MIIQKFWNLKSKIDFWIHSWINMVGVIFLKILADEIKIKLQAYLKKERKNKWKTHTWYEVGVYEVQICMKRGKGCVIRFETFRFNYLIIIHSTYLTSFLRNETRNRRWSHLKMFVMTVINKKYTFFIATLRIVKLDFSWYVCTT